MFSSKSVAVCLLTFATFLSTATSHTVLTYPGWRGDNLHSSGTVVDTNGLSVYSTGNGTLHPYGMQWEYPCKQDMIIEDQN